MEDLTTNNPEIFQNIDILSIITKNYDFLSLKDRENVLSIVESNRNLSAQEKEKLEKKIFSDMIAHTKTLYNSDILEKTLNIAMSTIECTLSVVYPKSDPEPKIDLYWIYRLSSDAYIDMNGVNILSNGIIWSLRGISGKISIRGSRNIDLNIYSNDRDTLYIEEYRHSGLVQKAWLKEYKLHNINNPARILINRDKITYRWYVDGKPYRSDDKPTTEIRNINTDILQHESWYNQDSELHRVGKPAEIGYYDTGEKWYEYWRVEDQLHRENLPAKIFYDKNGRVVRETWYFDGIKDRVGEGPVEIAYLSDGETEMSFERGGIDDGDY